MLAYSEYIKTSADKLIELLEQAPVGKHRKLD